MKMKLKLGGTGHVGKSAKQNSSWNVRWFLYKTSV